MALITRGTEVVLRRDRKTAQLPLADIELRGTETTLQSIETRLLDSLNTALSPNVVAIHIRALSPLKYTLTLGPPGMRLEREWWNRFRGI